MRFMLAASLLVLGAKSAFATKYVSNSCTVPAKITGHVDVACNNKGGPTITFGGVLATDEISATVIFTNNRKFTHVAEEDVTASLTLSSGEEFTFAKQPPLGGVGGNPHIFFLPYCDYDKAVYLGRCVQGGGDIDLDDLLELDGDWEVTSGDCTNNPGPKITLEGEFTVSKTVDGCFLFKNNVNNPQHIRKEDGDLDVFITILDEGEKIVIPKQPVLGGAGGNPLIFLDFGNDYCECDPDDPILIGRCNKI